MFLDFRRFDPLFFQIRAFNDSLLFNVKPLKNFNSSASELKSLKIGSASFFIAITNLTIFSAPGASMAPNNFL